MPRIDSSLSLFMQNSAGRSFGFTALYAMVLALNACTAAPPVEVTEPTGQLVLKHDTLLVPPGDFDYTGEATYVLPNGSKLTGRFENGFLSGKGREETSYGLYEGNFESGQRSGLGRQTENNGAVYDGRWQANQRDGLGAQLYADGSGYEGEWREDKHHGFGAWRSESGARYDGSWSRGLRHGYGVENAVNGVIYEGMWRENKRSGYGREIRPDGSLYAGEWKNGLKQGKGEARLPNGARHNGIWEAGQILGIGTRVTPQGIELSGVWTMNLFANGMVTLPDGRVFAGPVFVERGRKASRAFTAWLEQEADSGSAYAQYLLAVVLMDLPFQDQNTYSVTTLLQNAVTHGDIADAHYRLAVLLRPSNPPQSLNHLVKASTQDHRAAHALLGEYYHSGSHLRKDLIAAAVHYEAAARQGHASAKNNLAWLLATHPGDQADPQRAVDLIQPLVLYTGNWQYLDTLAAAHAALNHFRLATRIQKQAIQSYRQTQAVEPEENGALEALLSRLRLYEADTPYRE